MSGIRTNKEVILDFIKTNNPEDCRAVMLSPLATELTVLGEVPEDFDPSPLQLLVGIGTINMFLSDKDPFDYDGYKTLTDDHPMTIRTIRFLGSYQQYRKSRHYTLSVDMAKFSVSTRKVIFEGFGNIEELEVSSPPPRTIIKSCPKMQEIELTN